MGSGSMTLSIIIVNFNAAHYIPRCLESIFAHPLPFQFEVIVVDNASTDGSVELVESEYPQVNLIRNSNNLGFAAANNKALEVVTGDYILMLNPDTQVINNSLAGIISFMRENPKTGCVGCRLLNEDGTLQWSCHYYVTLWRLLLRKLVPVDWLYNKLPDRWKLRMTRFSYDTILSVDYVKGAFMIFPKLALDEVGFLDERFWLYSEEADICLRLRQHGWDTLFYPGATVVHARDYYSKQVPGYFTRGRRTISRIKFMAKYRGPLYANFYRILAIIFHSLSAPFIIIHPYDIKNRIRNYSGYLKALITLQYPK